MISWKIDSFWTEVTGMTRLPDHFNHRPQAFSSYYFKLTWLWTNLCTRFSVYKSGLQNGLYFYVTLGPLNILLKRGQYKTQPYNLPKTTQCGEASGFERQ